VCESNAPLTSKTPIAGFEDRESHRTPFASVLGLPFLYSTGGLACGGSSEEMSCLFGSKPSSLFLPT
jgi:hypothetical protein